jgi:hypothetical protein
MYDLQLTIDDYLTSQQATARNSKAKSHVFLLPVPLYCVRARRWGAAAMLPGASAAPALQQRAHLANQYP